MSAIVFIINLPDGHFIRLLNVLTLSEIVSLLQNVIYQIFDLFLSLIGWYIWSLLIKSWLENRY